MDPKQIIVKKLISLTDNLSYSVAESKLIYSDDVARGMISALYAAHRYGLCHRAITPSSFYEKDGKIILGGFEHGVVENTNSYIICDTNPREYKGIKINSYADYDVWCLGQALLSLRGKEVDETKDSYDIVLQSAINPDPDKRPCMYALKNICGIPTISLPKTSIYNRISPTQIGWLPLLMTDPKAYQDKINDETPPIRLPRHPTASLMAKLLEWIPNKMWSPSGLYCLAIMTLTAMELPIPKDSILDPYDMSPANPDQNAHIQAYLAKIDF